MTPVCNSYRQEVEETEVTKLTQTTFPFIKGVHTRGALGASDPPPQDFGTYDLWNTWIHSFTQIKGIYTLH